MNYIFKILLCFFTGSCLFPGISPISKEEQTQTKLFMERHFLKKKNQAYLKLGLVGTVVSAALVINYFLDKQASEQTLEELKNISENQNVNISLIESIKAYSLNKNYWKSFVSNSIGNFLAIPLKIGGALLISKTIADLWHSTSQPNKKELPQKIMRLAIIGDTLRDQIFTRPQEEQSYLEDPENIEVCLNLYKEALLDIDALVKIFSSKTSSDQPEFGFLKILTLQVNRNIGAYNFLVQELNKKTQTNIQELVTTFLLQFDSLIKTCYNHYALENNGIEND